MRLLYTVFLDFAFVLATFAAGVCFLIFTFFAAPLLSFIVFATSSWGCSTFFYPAWDLVLFLVADGLGFSASIFVGSCYFYRLRTIDMICGCKIIFNFTLNSRLSLIHI